MEIEVALEEFLARPDNANTGTPVHTAASTVSRHGSDGRYHLVTVSSSFESASPRY